MMREDYLNYGTRATSGGGQFLLDEICINLMWNRRRMVVHPPLREQRDGEWVYEISFDGPKKRGTSGVDSRNMCESCTHVYPVFYASRRESLIMSCPERRREPGTRDHFGVNFFDFAAQNSSHFDMLNNGHMLKSFGLFVLYCPPPSIHGSK